MLKSSHPHAQSSNSHAEALLTHSLGDPTTHMLRVTTLMLRGPAVMFRSHTRAPTSMLVFPCRPSQLTSLSQQLVMTRRRRRKRRASCRRPLLRGMQLRDQRRRERWVGYNMLCVSTQTCMMTCMMTCMRAECVMLLPCICQLRQ
jgi:hypothetical protein